MGKRVILVAADRRPLRFSCSVRFRGRPFFPIFAMAIVGAGLAFGPGGLIFGRTGNPDGARAAGSPAKPVRVLILSGQNNHDWKTTTPKLRAILEASGRFAVEVTERPDLFTAEVLAPFDVILSNWNAYGRDPASSEWPEAAKRAYIDFVRGGKGHVVVHAGSASFPNWPEYLELTLATFKPGQTYHGTYHEFPVRIDVPDHPVTRGLKSFTIADELWNRIEITGHPAVLASAFSSVETQGTGRWEPSVLADSFGKGRSISIFLGHDVEAMANPGFQALLVRGVEWAATGRVDERVHITGSTVSQAPDGQATRTARAGGSSAAGAGLESTYRGSGARDSSAAQAKRSYAVTPEYLRSPAMMRYGPDISGSVTTFRRTPLHEIQATGPRLKGLSSMEWAEERGKSLALVGPAGVIWRFHYDPALDTPYFHPVETTDGLTLTADAPSDHPWHHGLWFSWKFIDKVNYWEIDAKSGHPLGKTSWKAPKIRTAKDHGARIDMELTYAPAGEPGSPTEPAVLSEKRTIEISAPDADGVYTLDWTCAFRAVRTVLLDRTPLPGELGGQTWGGYAGLSVRLAQDLTERQPVSSDGPIGDFSEDRHRGRHTAVDYAALIGGRPAGIAICDHPANPRTPTPWYVIRSAEMSFFTPAILCYEPMTLEAGQALVLRYRILVHPGRWDAGHLRREYERFAGRHPQWP